MFFAIFIDSSFSEREEEKTRTTISFLVKIKLINLEKSFIILKLNILHSLQPNFFISSTVAASTYSSMDFPTANNEMY